MTAPRTETSLSAIAGTYQRVRHASQAENEAQRQVGAKVRARPGLIACRIPKGYDGGSDDPNDVRLYARKRHLAAAHDPVTGKPDLRYFIEILI